MEYLITTTNGELYHHGIKGQKWGVRRYQNPDGTLTAKGKQRYGLKTFNSNSAARGQMSPQAKATAMELGGVALVAVAAIGINRAVNKAYARTDAKQIDDLYKHRSIENLSSAPKLKKPMSAKESVKLVNPDYPKGGTTDNCTFCTMAMVMREKGYDVTANKKMTGVYDENVTKLWKNGGEYNKIKAFKSTDVIKKLNNEPDGAYGNLTVEWKVGGGHSVFWKNEDGKTHIYDGQTGRELNVSSIHSSSFLNDITPLGARYQRLDNAEPDERILASLDKK